MITRTQYFMMGIMFGVSFVYLIKESFIIYPVVIMILIIIALVLMEKREYYYNEYLKNENGVKITPNS